jgi:hypothetical protein
MATTEVDALPEVTTITKHNRVDVAKALKMRVQGATLPDIAAIQGVSPQAIDQALKKFEPFIKGLEPGQLAAYSEERANLFNAVEMHLTASLLDADTMAKASLNNRAYAFKQIHEARRLESGQSTANLSVLGKIVTAAEDRLGTPQPVVTKGQQPAVADAVPSNTNELPATSCTLLKSTKPKRTRKKRDAKA